MKKYKGILALLAAGMIAAAGVHISAEETEASDVEIIEETEITDPAAEPMETVSVNSLEIVTIPSSITEFQSLLVNCDNLKVINLPDTLTSISYQAINHCECLAEIIFPKSLNHLGRLAFQDNYFFEVAYFKGNAPEIEEYAFEDVSPVFTIYYNEFTSGWYTPKWNGFDAYPYTPDVLPDAYTAGLSSENTTAVPGDTVSERIVSAKRTSDVEK